RRGGCTAHPTGRRIPRSRLWGQYGRARNEPTGGKRMAGRRDTDLVEDLVRQYLKEIGEYELLTAADEVELAKTMEAGLRASSELEDAASLTSAPRRRLEAQAAAGRQAKQRFIQSNLRLVVSIAK